MSSCRDFTPNRTVQTIAHGSTATLAASDCVNLAGVPILPPSNAFRCGAKTRNQTLMTTCCGDNAVEDYLGCFMHCASGRDRASDLTNFVDCISTGGNTNATSEDLEQVAWNTFCQGPVSSTVQRSAAAKSRSNPGYQYTFLTAVLTVLLLTRSVHADCSFSIENDSTFIRQGLPRDIFAAGLTCAGVNAGSNNYCSMYLTGSITTDNRTINGTDASDEAYDSFFEVLGRTTMPPRLFPASVSFNVSHLEPVQLDTTLFTWWASWNVGRNPRRTNVLRILTNDPF